MKISMDKKYKTRNSKDVRILCVDRNDKDYPVIAISDDGDLFTYTCDGEYMTNSESSHDLIEVKEKRYVNVYFNQECGYHLYVYESKKEADKNAAPDRLVIAEFDKPKGDE